MWRLGGNKSSWDGQKCQGKVPLGEGLVFANQGHRCPDQWFSKRGLWTSIRVTWELIRNVTSQVQPQTYWTKNWVLGQHVVIFTSLLGDSDAA